MFIFFIEHRMNANTLAKLQALTHNRFALSQKNDDFGEIRHAIALAYHQPLNSDDWWLIGTDGCHLCDIAHQNIQIASTAYPMPSVQLLEILEFDDDIANIFAHLIPILITKDSLHCYPFGVADIIKLL